MRTKSNILLRLLSFATVLGIIFSTASCKNDNLTDNSPFTLYYYGVTDMGASEIITLSPTYHGGQPSNFAITGVTLENEPFESESFTIDEVTGILKINNTEGFKPGLYYISISCVVDGSTRNFPNVIRVELLPSIPAGITMSKPLLEADYANIISSSTDLDTVKSEVLTDGNHISITHYAVAGARKADGKVVANADQLINISKEGVVTINKGNKDFLPGVYSFDFRLKTRVSGQSEEEGLFKDALTVKIYSSPLELKYTPSVGKAEAGKAWTSTIPEYIGGDDDLEFSIISANAKSSEQKNQTCTGLTIDTKTGQLSLPENNELEIGEEFVISIKAKNAYGEKEFENVCEIKIVAYIHPITKLSYANIDGHVETVSFTHPLTECDGTEVTFSFKDLDPTLHELTIDPITGEIAAPKKHSLPIGKHNITVEAVNAKGTMEATFTLEIVYNTNKFTYVSWGNNLGLTPVEKYASQYRINEGEKLPINVVASDIAEGKKVSYKLINNRDFSHNEIPNEEGLEGAFNKETGSFTVAYDRDRGIGFTTVQVTVGEGEAAIVKKFPIFFNNTFSKNPVEKIGYELQYTPFVLKVNPTKGGESVVPKIFDAKKKQELPANDNLSINMLRDFSYLNLNGPEEHISGKLDFKSAKPEQQEPLFLGCLWRKYYKTINKPVSYGSYQPISYWDNEKTLNAALLYHKLNGAVIVNPNKFIGDDAVPANGVFTAQTYVNPTKEGNPGKPKGSTFFIAVWLDTDF